MNAKDREGWKVLAAAGGGFLGGFQTVAIVRGGKGCQRIDGNARAFIVGKVVRFDTRTNTVVMDPCRVVEIRTPAPNGNGLVTVWKASK